MSAGMDAAAIYSAAHQSARVEDEVQKLRKTYVKKKIIVGVDRLDTVECVVQKLEAFETLLERYPEWRDEVVLILVTSPHNVQKRNMHQMSQASHKIQELVSRISGTYGSIDFAHVEYYPRYLSEEEYFVLLRVADVGLVTSVRDEVNTTIMQYVICQKDNHGPLILSEPSRISGNPTNSPIVSPRNSAEMANCMHRSLSMSKEERKSQYDKAYDEAYEKATSRRIQDWNELFLDQTPASFAFATLKGSGGPTPVLDKEEVLNKFQVAERGLFLFDYDGTLTEIVSNPAAALPSVRLIHALTALARDSKNDVWIISGRDQAFLDEHLGTIPGLGLSAEHGAFVKYPKGQTWENATEKTDMSWREHVMDIFRYYMEQTPGSTIEQKLVTLTWHYRNADPVSGGNQAELCEQTLKNTVGKDFDVEIMTGKANVEVRPRLVNKGETVKRLIGHGSASKTHGGPDFVLCFGDDHTDEDMFRAVSASGVPKEKAFTCLVGPSWKHTNADWHLPGPSDVISTIEMLTPEVEMGER